jgi:lathosterol oxidase
VNPLFQWFEQQSLGSWIFFSIVSNFGIAAASVAGCWLIARCFPKRRLFTVAQPVTTHDLWLAAGCILLNASVSIVGWILWKAGWIRLTFPGWQRTILDTALLLAYMDAGMYVTHLVVHHPRLFAIVHKTHHAHESTNPLSLFVLSPLEVLGFGSLLISALLAFPLSAIALLIYLTLNIAFGTLGHAGVEPFPRVWFRNPLFRQIGTSTFHGLHHADRKHNFGFYTVIWDRIFGTIHPDYDKLVGGPSNAKRA